MARIEKFKKEDIMNKSVEFIKEKGISELNVRNLASYIGCSTQPLFRNYKNIEELKFDLKNYLHKDYELFISKYVEKDNYLLTISYAYAIYAMKNPNSFSALFISDLAGSRTVKEVINSTWNKDTIEAMTKQYKISRDKAEEIYRDVRFYTHGIACQLSAKSIKLTDNELFNLIDDLINKLIKE